MIHNKTGIKEQLAAAVSGVLLLIIILITSTQALCYWIPGWWRNVYAKYDTPQYVTGEMSLDDAVYITEEMLEYCIGRLDSLDNVEAEIDGVTAPFFTEREKSHLSDCRSVFHGAIMLRAASILMIIGLVMWIYFSVRRRREKETGGYDPAAPKVKVSGEVLRILSAGYLRGLAVVVVLAVIIALIGMHDFTYLFTKFHHVFFDNDLWILDPARDNLVNVMQESVFSNAAITIALIWAAVSAILAAISAIYLKKK